MQARHKFSAAKVEHDGFTFASKLEAKHYQHLKAEKAAGRVVCFIPQNPVFRLPDGARYTCDFLVFFADGTCEAQEVKGWDDDRSRVKRAWVASLYPEIPIKVLGPARNRADVLRKKKKKGEKEGG